MPKYAVVDVETSGGTPQTSRITEIAVFIHDGSQVVANFHSLINPDRLIDPFVVQLTGITQEMVADAPFFGDIAEQIAHLTRDCIFVAHNVSFDYGMLRHEFKLLGQDFRLPHLCTVRAAKHILTLGPAAILGARRVVQSIVDADTAPAKRECYQRLLTTRISDDAETRRTQFDQNPGLWLRVHPNVRSLILPNVIEN